VAEYIQASARVGRTYPGLSFLVITPQSARDRSIFDRFGIWHSYLDRLVDPAAINRWPPLALERTIVGVLAGYLMTVAAGRLRMSLDTVPKVQSAASDPAIEELTMESVTNWMQGALGAARAPWSGYAETIRDIVGRRYGLLLSTPPGRITNPVLQQFLGSMRSLRDIDDPAYVDLPWPTDNLLLRAFKRTQKLTGQK
jgi:hypothetical protein